MNISPGDIDCVRILLTSSSTRPSLYLSFGIYIVHGHRRNLMCLKSKCTPMPICTCTRRCFHEIFRTLQFFQFSILKALHQNLIIWNHSCLANICGFFLRMQLYQGLHGQFPGYRVYKSSVLVSLCKPMNFLLRNMPTFGNLIIGYWLFAQTFASLSPKVGFGTYFLVQLGLSMTCSRTESCNR